jgi:hypothetical protein
MQCSHSLTYDWGRMQGSRLLIPPHLRLLACNRDTVKSNNVASVQSGAKLVRGGADGTAKVEGDGANIPLAKLPKTNSPTPNVARCLSHSHSPSLSLYINRFKSHLPNSTASQIFSLRKTKSRHCSHCFCRILPS